MILLMIALFGLFIPNGIFVYYMVAEFNQLSDILHNYLALAFIIEAFMVTGLCGYYFAFRPVGKIKWYWFIILSLIGGLGFSLPLYWWLNQKKVSDKINQIDTMYNLNQAQIIDEEHSNFK